MTEANKNEGKKCQRKIFSWEKNVQKVKSLFKKYPSIKISMKNWQSSSFEKKIGYKKNSKLYIL